MGASVFPECPMDGMDLKKGIPLRFPPPLKKQGMTAFPCPEPVTERNSAPVSWSRAPCHVRSPFELTGKSTQVSFKELPTLCR
ncbi:hypothetical protein CXU00_03505 [Akkermansia muciniphila]|nr:hypothetical protein CXU00_03505 [Akkermansia muciniphila]